MVYFKVCRVELTCHDNASVESFFHTMKVEMNYYTHHFKTKKELIKRMESV